MQTKAAGGIVINEIMYHPPDDRDDLQFIELLNSGGQSVDLSGWHFTKGIKYSFPAGTRLEVGGYLVLCRDRAAFAKQYGADVPLVGPFEGRLSHDGERIELSDSADAPVDAVKYGDTSPWPMSPDGYSASLERICPSESADLPGNWASSELPDLRRPVGTPGRKNSCHSANLPPFIADVVLTAPDAKGEGDYKVSAKVSDLDGVKSVRLNLSLVSATKSWPETALEMKRVSGDRREGRYEVRIPAPGRDMLVRYRVEATDEKGTQRSEPSINEVRPAWTFSTFTNRNPAQIPQAILLQSQKGATQGYRRFGNAQEGEKVRGRDAFIYMPPADGAVETFDFVQSPPRKGGYNVHFLKDQAFHSMTSINVIFEGPRYTLAEPLSYELYRLAGVPTEQSEHLRLTVGDRELGYHLMVEQPNKGFLKRNGRDDTGNLYKLIWYGGSLIEKHEKKTNVTMGHADLLEVVKGLNETSGDAQWKFIKEHFNIENFINYYAVNMCIQNWDGFHNNYFTYHDTGKSGLWEIYPWDEDKTWGDYDGASMRYDWYQMPLTFGMNDGTARSDLRGAYMTGGFNGWRREPGVFSGPLLANPVFRARFLKRLREVCTDVFTEQRMLPIIDGMEKRLQDEVAYRSQVATQGRTDALSAFRGHIQSFRDQLTNRRKFILAELDKSEAKSTATDR
jgi:spore coat protein H